MSLLVLISSFVSVAELGVAHFLSTLILPSEGRPSRGLFAEAALLIAALGVLRLVGYAQSTYRVTVFEQAFGKSVHDTELSPWRWAEAMELLTLLMSFSRMLVLSVGLAFFSLEFALANFATLVLILQVFSSTMRRQYETQRSLRRQGNAGRGVSSAVKVRARIKAAEVASLISAVFSMGLFAFLVWLYVNQHVSAGVALVLFLAARMLSGLYANASSSLMRFVRARVYAEA